MAYEFLLSDLKNNLTQKRVGTDKGLAKIGDGIVNLAYSVAKSVYITKKTNNNSRTRTGLKVSKTILSNALKNADMKMFAKNRADAHDMADTVEAIVAYIWLDEKMSLQEIIDFLIENISGDLSNRNDEIQNAIDVFTSLLIHIKKFLPEN